MKKRIVKKDTPMPKLRVAAAVFAVAFSGAGCGEFPQCQVNYSNSATSACKNALGKIKEAKKKFGQLNKYRELARSRLEEEIKKGKNYPSGIDEYNICLKEMIRISAKLSLLGEVSQKTEDGKIRENELEKIDIEMDGVLSQIARLKGEFLEIIGQN